MAESELEKAEREIAERFKLRHQLYRWVAAIREALISELRRSRNLLEDLREAEFEIIKRDLNQCERILKGGLGVPIDHDPVLEIWLRDRERAGVRWFDFEPKEGP